MDTTALRSSLQALSETIQESGFVLPRPDREEHEEARRALARTVSQYLLPRLRDPDAPVVAAVAGPSGVGKSIIVNTLAAQAVSATGPLRPTTTGPVVWAHREHSGQSWSEFVGRIRERVGPALEVVVGDDPLTRDLTVIDTPPLDFTAGDVRVAPEIVALADLCVFVTSPGRYADAASWEFLREVKRRGVPLLFVMNRLPGDEADRTELLADYSRRLHHAGLLLEPDPSLVFAIVSAADGGNDVLPAAAVATIRSELGELADPQFRSRLVSQTTEGAVRSLGDAAGDLAAAFDLEHELARALIDIVEESYATRLEELDAEIGTGAMAWLVSHDHWPSAAVDLTGIVTRRAGVAAQDAAVAWSGDPVGKRYLDEGGEGLWRHGHDTTYESQRHLEEWFGELEVLAARRTRRGRLGSRKRRAVADALWRAVFRAEDDPPTSLRRRYREHAPDLIRDARGELRAALERTLGVDAARFLDLIGPAGAPSPGEAVRRHRAAILDALGGPGELEGAGEETA